MKGIKKHEKDAASTDYRMGAFGIASAAERQQLTMTTVAAGGLIITFSQVASQDWTAIITGEGVGLHLGGANTLGECQSLVGALIEHLFERSLNDYWKAVCTTE